ncbi:PREDICTED: bax inhibitor 1-like isoform X2 [Capra hircus]|uniref:bax inhibitor 1-like isoform X2 n=1 Tax=Capra hircus TaxID=9925 RepID=UPI0008471A74|nr:PREDICTED: bax inhibitor 1-like isoform X2 [Capra hircus]
MDLEVSEPIDFGSGDHQHLVRKAADAYVGGKSVRSYGTVPSTQEPQQARGNPHSKAGKRADTYVVQISPETTTDDINPGPFSETAVRRAFIVKVFFLLSIQLLITGAIVSLFVFCKALRSWVIKNPWFNYTLLPAFFVIFIVLACCGKLRRQVPANYILLGLFTVLQGLLLGTVSVFYNAEEVLWATGATALVTLSLSLFALQTKWLHLLYAGLGTVIFSLYLVMDVQLMVGGRHHHSDLDPEEYVFAALNIYMDIINLFLFILQLIGMGR